MTPVMVAPRISRIEVVRDPPKRVKAVGESVEGLRKIRKCWPAGVTSSAVGLIVVYSDISCSVNLGLVEIDEVPGLLVISPGIRCRNSTDDNHRVSDVWSVHK